MANERGRRGDYGRDWRGDYETDDLRYGDRWQGGSYSGGQQSGRYGQQRGEAFSRGGWDRDIGSEQYGSRQSGDWFGGGQEDMSRGSSMSRGDYGGQMGGYGPSGDRWSGMSGSDYGSDYGRYGSYGSSRGYGQGYGTGGGSYPSSRQGRYYGSSGYSGSAYGGSRQRGYGQDDRGFFEKAGDEVASWFGDEDAERRRRMDQQHRGRGPRGYQRSDERIREDVNDRLTDDWLLDASEIEVEVSGSEVTLSGEVSSREDKRRAEDIADDVSGVTHVQNNLRVKSSDYSSSAGGTTPTSGGRTGSTI